MPAGPAAAAPPASSSADIEADQAIRYQTELMVLSDTCGGDIYRDFTLRNRDAIIVYQQADDGSFPPHRRAQPAGEPRQLPDPDRERGGACSDAGATGRRRCAAARPTSSPRRSPGSAAIPQRAAALAAENAKRLPTVPAMMTRARLRSRALDRRRLAPRPRRRRACARRAAAERLQDRRAQARLFGPGLHRRRQGLFRRGRARPPRWSISMRRSRSRWRRSRATSMSASPASPPASTISPARASCASSARRAARSRAITSSPISPATAPMMPGSRASTICPAIRWR